MCNDGIIEKLLVLMILVGPIILYYIMKQRNREYRSAEVAYIMETDYKLSSMAFSEPYYFGSLSDENFKLYKEVEQRLFEEGYDYGFTHNNGGNGLIKKSVKEWKRLGYLKEKEIDVRL